MTRDSQRILVFDDDERYREAISAYLVANGYEALAVAEVGDFEAAMRGYAPDLVLLDQRLGETTGTEVLKRLRDLSEIPCIIVTGMPDPTDRIVNLEIGADDEIDKGTPPRELLAHIRAVLRRACRRRVDPWRWDAGAKVGSVWHFSVADRDLFRPDGTPCRLTSSEFEIMRSLVEAKGAPVSRAALCERALGRPHRVDDRSVDTMVGKIRSKLGPNGTDLEIKAVRGVGYVLTGIIDA